jgi:hypothetical protein
MTSIDFLKIAAKWLNDNQGVLSLILFFATIFLGWISGIWNALARKPKFQFRLIDGPTFCCTFLIGKKHGEFDVHRSAFAIYLHISNTGAAPASINEVHIAYHWHLNPFSLQWVRYRIGWFWLKQQTTVITDFQVDIGDNIKLYPFLFQRSTMSGHSADTFLQMGQSVNGVVYFEQSDSWGGCFPSAENGQVRIKIRLIDAFGGKHTKRFNIPSFSLDEARKFNPSFGETLAHLNREVPKEGEIVSDETSQTP